MFHAEGDYIAACVAAIGFSFTASISGLTANPTYGLTAQIGVELTGSIAGLEGGETVVHIWTLNGSPIDGAESAAYTPVSGDDPGALRYAPTVDSVSVVSAPYSVRYAPPVAAGGLADKTLTVDVAITSINVASDFTGSGISYALAPSSAALPAGLSLNTSTGLITGTPTAIAGSVNIIVRGTNTGGYADTAFSVTIAETVTHFEWSADGTYGESYQERTGVSATTPAVGGDVVGTMRSGSVNLISNDAAAANTLDAGRNILRGDGTYGMIGDIGPIDGPATLIWAGKRSAPVDNAIIVEMAAAVRGDAMAQLVQKTTGNQFAVREGGFANIASTTSPYTEGEHVIYSLQIAQDDFEFFENSESIATDTSGVWPDASITKLSIFIGTNGAEVTAAVSDCLYVGVFSAMSDVQLLAKIAQVQALVDEASVVTPTINGLTGGNAVIGDHASITMSVSYGTITARKWGSTSGGSEYGTGTSPTDYTAGDGGALYATATVDSVDYTVSAPIIYAAPVAAGGISDQDYPQDEAITTLDVASDFTGGGITYALAPSSDALPAGLSLATNGQITGTPTAEAAEVNIIVRGTNSGGFDDTAFGVTISAAVTAAVITSVTAGTIAAGELPVEITATGDLTGSTVYLVMVPSGDTAPTATEIAAGQESGGGAPLASGSGIWGSVPNITLPTGIDETVKVYAVIDNGALSNVGASAAVAVNTTVPAYESSVPADGGTDIAIASTIVLTFDQTVVAGSGTFTLYDVTGTAAEETFTVGGAGDNGGTIGVSGTDVTLTPGASMANSNDYSVRWSAGAVKGSASYVDVEANTGDTLVNFTTVAAVSGALWDDSFDASQASPMPSYSLGDIAAATTGYSAYIAGSDTDGPEVVDIGGDRALSVTNGLGTRDRWLTLDYETYPDNRKMSVTVKQLCSNSSGDQNSFLLHRAASDNYVQLRIKSTGAVDLIILTPSGGSEVFETVASTTVVAEDVLSLEHNGTDIIFKVNDVTKRTHTWVSKPVSFGPPRVRMIAATSVTSIAYSNIKIEAA